MNYKQTLAYLYSALPMFHRVGAAAYKANLDNTFAICNLLHNPQHCLKCIHVAGTNGKGSTSHMLASILQAAGYRTGLYTSPHLKDFRERIRVNGKMISRQYVSKFVTLYKDDFEKIKPSFFEMTVGLAFQYFKDQRVDVAVIETGLGGRLDSTNIISPVLSVITNISYDHVNLLGDTLEKIAYEKAGIIKPETPVVIGEIKPETKNVFLKRATEMNAPVFFASKNFKAKFINDNGLVKIISRGKTGKNLRLDLTGRYQLRNLCTVLQSVELLKQDFSINSKQLAKGLSSVKKSTGLAGRWQTLSKRPLVIADTGHNEEGIKEVISMIKSTPHLELHVVLGMVNDKAIGNILKLLPQKATYYFCKAAIPRGLDADLLAQQAMSVGLKGATYSSVNAALTSAKKNAKPKDLIFVGGSNFTVAEVV